MKKSIQFLFLAFVAVALASCDMFNKTTPSYQLSDLQGLWLENDDVTFGHYVRFTKEQSEETGYLYGREWDEAEDITEDDLLPKGNGWFKYLFETTGSLTEIHLMDNGGAEIPKVYVVTVLNDTELSYYEKDHKSIKFNFTKVVTTK